MSDEFKGMADVEIVSLINRVEHELQRRRLASKETLRLEIEERLKAAGLDLGDLFTEVGGKIGKKRQVSDRAPVKPKYRDRSLRRNGLVGALVRLAGCSASCLSVAGCWRSSRNRANTKPEPNNSPACPPNLGRPESLLDF